jgi:hypothetical protein
MIRRILVFLVSILHSSVLLLSLAAQEDVIISEFMADNASCLTDQDGQFSDWIEIYNPTLSSINLEGYSLTDDPGVLTKWTFPAVTLQPGAYLIVFASGNDRANPGAELHANFQLNADGEFLALVKPDGVTVLSAFSPAFPPQKEDVPYGVAQTSISTPLLANSAPQILVPTNGAMLAPDWNLPGFQPDATWFSGSAPAALGFDTNQPVATLVNLASGGTAVQSTTGNGLTANLATDGNLANTTETLGTDNAPFWQVTLASEAAIYRVLLYNRSSCCQSRLRDITVHILAANGLTNYSSPLLNPENAGFAYPGGPALLDVNVEALAGGAVPGKVIRVTRLPDIDLSGSGGQGGTDEQAVLSLAEVEVMGVPAAMEVNLARTGTPAPTATQSSTLSSYTPSLAINGNLGDFTHTLGTDANAAWTLNLGRRAVISSVTLHNRDDCCGSRLRDVTVQILDADGSTVLYTSPLLNPENTGFTYPNGPDNLVVDLADQSLVGQFVRVRRAPDSDLSGTGGQGNTDEPNVLSLGEVIVLGYDVSGYRPFIRTDLQTRMLGKNASAFVRLPFVVDDPAILKRLTFRARYDDGFIAYLNGVKVLARNAPVAPAWDSVATSDRGLAEGIGAETIDLSAALSELVAGTNLLAIQVLNSGAANGDLLLQPELTATSVTVSGPAYLMDATPGTQNDTEPFYGDVADTQFSVDRGFFGAPFQLEITSDTPEAAIYYSFDSSEPGPTKGMLYTGPITITNSTVVRARAFKTGLRPTDIDTQSYLFLDDVIYQAPTGAAPPYFPASWGNNRVDYGMDPNVISKYTLAQWREALTQIPSISLVTEMANLFDPSIGIYANALQHGIDWERPGSIELLDPHTTPHSRFQENCGLRIRGGYSRNPEFIKHSFRVFFRREYGAPKLHYPMFENDGANEFDTFDLRTSQNYAWPRGESPTHDTMVREVFCRETLGAMGQPYRRSRYYHLYVNGQYWGLYETDERPEASYGATYFGGNKDDYDVVKCANHVGNFVTEVTDGNFTAWSNLWVMVGSMATDSSTANYFRILGRYPDGTRNPALPVMIDVDNLIVYMLGIFYSGDGDATLSAFLSNTRPNNWFGMRNRNNPEMGFRFFNSDCEHTLGAPSWQADRTGPFGGISGSNIRNFTYSNPQYFHEDLMRNAEYRLRFADHVHKHFFNSGALIPQAGTNRFLRKAVQITKAIRAYSARWGDGAPHEPPYGESEWTNMINTIVTTWFPTRTATVLQQLRADDLYPAVAAPAFSQHGGDITEGFVLTMSHTNATGTIYYTLDGSDPRQVGGNLLPSAAEYTGPVVLNLSTRVKARVRSGSTWSALNEADFAIPAIALLRVTEIMFHPAPVTAAEAAAGFNNADDFEYIELRNVGPIAINLAGAHFVNGISFTFPSGTLGPGEYVLLVKSPLAFIYRYGARNVAGTYEGNLNNLGERITLQDVAGRTILDFTYSDAWCPVTDGFGFSLVIANDAAPSVAWNNGTSWRQSSALGGSPGAANPQPSLFPFVVINELLSRPAGSGLVSVELANLSPDPADIGGWWLTDAFRSPRKLQFPPNTIIAGGGFLVLTEDDFGPAALGTNALQFSTAGAEVRLFSAAANGNLTGYYQGWDFGAAEEGMSFGRHVTSTGADHFVAQTEATLGSINAEPRVGPVVISELMYRSFDDGTNDYEFIELLNITTNTVELYDPALPDNTWRIAGGVDYVFWPGQTLGPGEYLLLVNVELAVDPVRLAEFRARYGIAPETPIYPFAGRLENGGDDVELQRPTLLPTGQPAYVRVEKVSYQDSAPWPGGADGYGLSLQRLDPAAYGNDQANWVATGPSPVKALALVGAPPVISQHPVGLIVPTGRDFTLSVTATGPEPLRYQWRLDGSILLGATGPTYTVSGALPIQSGQYRVLVYNEGGSVVSDPASVSVLPPPQIVTQPADVTVTPSNNVSFTVVASSTQLLSYQWRFNGLDIPGATSTTLLVTNVQFGVHDGEYSVAVSDEGGTSLSRAALLTILVKPEFIQNPVSQSVPQGGTAVFSAVARGTLPMGFRWRKNFGTAFQEVRNDTTTFLVLTNVQPTDAANYSVVATNAALVTPGTLSLSAALTVLTDTDRDGLPDSFETANSLDPNNAGDATLDGDGDGMSNLDEYRAGTDLADPLSYLKVQIQIDGTIQIQFLAKATKTYSVLCKNSLSDPVWLVLAQVPARAADQPQTVQDRAPAPTQRYYRLVTPAQP